ncbi:AAA family ATPase [Bacillus solimangrovi]|uniref:DNA topology modulation protein FlaR n=1 Tax=Bacillus solimangrovi TaxID=1305675 RepID=A0A1E5LIE1_9BACI|nr:AAA family ATPase [Bacillus solimangrovi]OEH93850.1 hypothetical protein BFG57_11050 [Bacillus solimangrovi]
MKIHIIGGSGSGKSTVAKQLSEKYSIPHYDLDAIFWDKNAEQYKIKAPVFIRDNKLKEIVGQPSWIIEGVYFTWLDPSFALADKIFVLHTPLSVQEERIWSRYYQRKTGLLSSTKKETINSVNELIDWNKKYIENYLPNFINNTKYKDKIIQLENNFAIFEYIS